MKYSGDRILFIDVETTGLNPGIDRIIEIGIVETIGERFTDNNLNFYLNPGVESAPEALAIHGITTEFLSDKKEFVDHVEEILSYIQGAHSIVMHNAIFDTSFISFELERIGYHPLPHYCRIIKDSLQLARDIHPNEKNDLSSLCIRYDLSLESRSKHGALTDAILLAQMVFQMINRNLEHESTREYLEDLRFPQTYDIQPMTSAERPLIFIVDPSDKAVHDRLMLFLEVVPEFNRLRKEQEENQFIFLDEKIN